MDCVDIFLKDIDVQSSSAEVLAESGRVVEMPQKRCCEVRSSGKLV